ncbi:MAG: rRNA maturation RNase YbeY [Myxococcales bacterium]|nr:rRNA maturation RNase YbeY [Myxococcales bacterium]
MRELGLSGRELSLALVGDRAIRRLNRAWRGTDRPTDVLSFPAGELAPGAPRPWPLGDVAISLDTARRVAAEEGVKLEDEVWRYLAHGLLHLLGFDHRRAADAGRMAQAERRLLGGRGMVSPGRGGARTRRRAASRPRTAPRVGR